MDTGVPTLISMVAGIMRRLLRYGLSTAVTPQVDCSATLIYAITRQCRDATVSRTAPGEASITLSRRFADLTQPQVPQASNALGVGLCHQPRLGAQY